MNCKLFTVFDSHSWNSEVWCILSYTVSSDLIAGVNGQLCCPSFIIAASLLNFQLNSRIYYIILHFIHQVPCVTLEIMSECIKLISVIPNASSEHVKTMHWILFEHFASLYRMRWNEELDTVTSNCDRCNFFHSHSQLSHTKMSKYYSCQANIPCVSSK